MESGRKFSPLSGLLLVLLIGGCMKLPKWPGSEHKGADGERPWYERNTFEGVFSDFDKTEKLIITDKKMLAELKARGEYLAKGAAACGSCHASSAGDPGSALSGGRLMTDRFGTVRAANITADRETGVGNWTVLELMRAMRAGIDREGKALSIDLHGGYRWMADSDARAIAVYLLTTDPVKHPIQRRKLSAFERNNWGVFPQHRNFEGYVPTISAKSGDQYGRYLAYHVSRCQFCHTSAGGTLSGPDAFSGAQGAGDMSVTQVAKSLFSTLLSYRPTKKAEPDLGGLVSADGARKLGQEPVNSAATDEAESPVGAPGGFSGNVREQALAEGSFPVGGPDIRGNSAEGLLAWSEDDILRYLQAGKTPDGAQRDGRFCPWPYFARMSEADQKAIAEYLKRI